MLRKITKSKSLNLVAVLALIFALLPSSPSAAAAPAKAVGVTPTNVFSGVSTTLTITEDASVGATATDHTWTADPAQNSDGASAPTSCSAITPGSAPKSTATVTVSGPVGSYCGYKVKTITAGGTSKDYYEFVITVMAPYTVNYDAQSGSVSPTSESYSGTALTTPTPTRSSYTFDGWYDAAAPGGTLVVGANASYSPSSSTTLYAHWTAAAYTVTYNPEGGAVSPTSQPYSFGGSALTTPTPTRAGYTFTGWYAAASGGARVDGGSGATGGSYTPSASITLHAQWTNAVYTVTYDAESGSVSPSSQSYTYGGSALTTPTPTRANYRFDGWYAAASGGSRVDGGSGATGGSYTPSADITLHAQWTEIRTVTYNSEGGSVSPSSQSYYVGELTLTTPTPTRTGYTFNGWFAAASGGSRIVTGGASYTPGASIELHAQWTADQYTVTYNANGGSLPHGSSPQTYTVGGTALTMPTPTWSRHAFVGWFTTATDTPIVGTFVTDSEGGYVPTESITLYARWAEVELDVRFLNNFKRDHYYTHQAITHLAAFTNYSGTGLVRYGYRVTGHAAECEAFGVGINSTDGEIDYEIKAPIAQDRGCDIVVDLYVDGVVVDTSPTYHIYYGPNRSLTATGGSGTANSAFGPTTAPTPNGFTCTPEDYTYTVSPALPAGLTMDPDTGVISGTPTSASASATYTIYVESCGQWAYQTITIEIADAPAVTATGGTGTVGTPFTTAAPTPSNFTCDPVDYTYTVSPALPAGLTIDPDTGVISGTPTAATASATYTIKAACGEEEATDDITILINAAPGTPAVTATGGTGTVGTPFTTAAPTPSNFTCDPVDYTYTVSPALPAGLTIDPDTGVISGTPTAATASATYTIKAACGAEEATDDITILINAAPGTPAVTATGGTGTVGTPFTTAAPTPSNFTCDPVDYTYTVSPALPAGLTIDPDTGVISGTPTAATASATYTIKAACGAEEATIGVTILINAAPVTPSLGGSGQNGTVGNLLTTPTPTPSNFTCEAPYLYSISPALPAGLNLNTATGVISGIPSATSTGTYRLTVGCDGQSAFVDITITVTEVSVAAPVELLDQTVLFQGDNFVFGNGSWTIVTPATATADPVLGAPKITYSIVADPRTTAQGCSITPEGVLSYTTGGSCYVVANAAAIGRYKAGTSQVVEMRAWVEGDLTETVLNPLGLTLLTGSGFTPNSLVRLELHSKVYFLGNVRADANGFVNVEVQLPAGAQLGDHEIWMIDLKGGDTYTGKEGFYIVKLGVKIIDKALAETGSNNVITGAISGSLLLLASGLMFLAGRRRKSA